MELFSIEVDLIEGKNGVFEIAQQAKILFSKKTMGRFPTRDELETLAVEWNRKL